MGQKHMGFVLLAASGKGQALALIKLVFLTLLARSPEHYPALQSQKAVTLTYLKNKQLVPFWLCRPYLDTGLPEVRLTQPVHVTENNTAIYCCIFKHYHGRHQRWWVCRNNLYLGTSFTINCIFQSLRVSENYTDLSK